MGNSSGRVKRIHRPPQKLTHKSSYKQCAHMVRCEFCNVRVPPENLKSHKSSCPDRPENIKYKCDFCQKTINLEEYQRHIATCEENPENITLECQFCSETFNTLARIITHQESCPVNPKNILVQCQFCDCEITADIFAEHEEMCRSNNIIQTCDTCTNMYIGSSYIRHLDGCKREKRRFDQEMQMEKEKEEKECCICMEDLDYNKDTVFLECMHKFHSKCIEDWSVKQRMCPVCRTEF